LSCHPIGGNTNDVGEKHWKRVKNVLRSRNALRPALYDLPKDHKPLNPGKEEESPL
jgi:hypothetical protein